MNPDIAKTTDLIAEQASLVDALRQEVNKVLVGQEKLLSRMLMAIVTGVDAEAVTATGAAAIATIKKSTSRNVKKGRPPLI